MQNYNQPFFQNNEQGKNSYNSLEIDQSGKTNLAEAAKWAKLLGVLGLIMLVIFFIAGVALFVLAPSMMSNIPQMKDFPMGGAFLGFLYIISGIICTYPTWALFQFGLLTRLGIKNENQAQFNSGLVYLKRFFKFIGVFTVIIIAIYILAIVAVTVGASFGSR